MRVVSVERRRFFSLSFLFSFLFLEFILFCARRGGFAKEEDEEASASSIAHLFSFFFFFSRL